MTNARIKYSRSEIKALWEAGVSGPEIAKRVGIAKANVNTVYAILKKMGCAMRGGSGRGRTLVLNDILDERGFIPSKGICYPTRMKLQDPLYRLGPASHILVAGPGRQGHRCQHGIHEFFGLPRIQEGYLVCDFEKFRRHMGERFSEMFFARNPEPSQGLFHSFSSWMRDYGFPVVKPLHLLIHPKLDQYQILQLAVSPLQTQGC